MGAKGDLAQKIIGQPGKFSGLNNFLDVQQAFKIAQQEYQFKAQLQGQQLQSEAAKGISQAGLVSGVTPDVSTAMQQYNSMTGGAGLATGNPSSQTPAAPSMQMQDSSSGFSKTASNTDTGIQIDAKPTEFSIKPEDNTKAWDGTPVLPGYKGANLQTRAFNNFKSTVNTYMQSRSSQVGALNTKVDQAILSQKLIDQYYDPQTKQYNVPPNKFYELSTGVAKILNPQGTLTNEQINGVNQASAQGDIGKALTYATGRLHNGSSQDIIKDTVATIQREGMAAEELRNNDISNLKKQVPPKLSVAAAKQIINSVAPNSYKDYIKNKSSSQNLSGESGNTLNKDNLFEGL